jgi:hypothetical protein
VLFTIPAMMPPRKPLNVIKLSDHFGQYVLILTCTCGHTRIAQPRTPGRYRGMGRGTIRCDQTVTMLALRISQLQRYGATRNETGWLRRSASKALHT